MCYCRAMPNELKEKVRLESDESTRIRWSQRKRGFVGLFPCHSSGTNIDVDPAEPHGE